VRRDQFFRDGLNRLAEDIYFSPGRSGNASNRKGKRVG